MTDRDFPYLSDHDDEERQGVGDMPLREDYEKIALRDQVAKQFEELLEAVEVWLEDDDSIEARSIYQDLLEIYERVGEPLEETDA